MARLCLTCRTMGLVLIFPILFIHGSALLPILNFYTDCIEGTNDSGLFGEDSVQSIPSLLSDLASNASTHIFYSSASGSGKTTSYGLFYCTANTDPQDCQDCVQSAATYVQSECLFYKQAYIFSTGCALHYSNLPVYAIEDHSPVFWSYLTGSVSYIGFNQTLSSTLTKLIPEAAASPRGFATDEVSLKLSTDKLYALAQCTPDIPGPHCENCLQIAFQNMTHYCNTTCPYAETDQMQTSLPSCQLLYQVRSGFQNTPWVNPGSSSPGNGGMKIWYVFIIALSVAAFVQFSH